MLFRILFFCICFLVTISLFGQTQIDGSFPFQTDANKKYTLIVPSTYSDATPTKVMLGLHPLNTARWSGETWCEYLTDFAEINNLLLVCPDGGADGKIDDPIDTAFTSVLLDSVGIWYQIQTDKMYAMGFSWGGRTTYTYGLSNTDRLHGFMPIGAAVSGVNIDAIAPNAQDQPFYFIHGSSDNPGANLTPFKELLEDNGAITNSKVLQGVGHTIDFNDNIAILTEAYRWIDSINCDTTTLTGLNLTTAKENVLSVFPNPVNIGSQVFMEWENSSKEEMEYRLLDITGQLLQKETWKINAGKKETMSINTTGLKSGLYFLSLTTSNGQVQTKRLLLR